MPRPIRSLAQRLAEEDRRAAMATVTRTERLLALLLVELMQTRANRETAELGATLKQAGFSQPQSAALLGTTQATLAVVAHRQRRRDRGEEP